MNLPKCSEPGCHPLLGSLRRTLRPQVSGLNTLYTLSRGLARSLKSTLSNGKYLWEEETPTSRGDSPISSIRVNVPLQAPIENPDLLLTRGILTTRDHGRPGAGGVCVVSSGPTQTTAVDGYISPRGAGYTLRQEMTWVNVLLDTEAPS